MSFILVDSNVLLDVFTRDPIWYERSANALSDAADITRLVINPIIYAEVSVRFSCAELLDQELPSNLFEREAIPFEAAFLAGKAFAEYRRRGGERRSPLPDFFVGAHAAVAGYRLLTRDADGYRSYFPQLEIIAP